MTFTTFAVGFFWAVLVYHGLRLFLTLRPPAGVSDPLPATLLNEIGDWLAILLRRGFNNGDVRFTHAETGRFLHFRKYIRRKGDYGIALAIPKPWSEEDLEKLRGYCDANGLAIAATIGEFIATTAAEIDCGHDTEKAARLAREIWTGIFGLLDQTEINFESNDIIEYDTLIDSRVQRRPTQFELDRDRREVMGHNVAIATGRLRWRSGVAVSLFIVLPYGIAFVALPIAMLAAYGDPPDWSLELRQLTLRGGIASLGFFVIYVLAFTAMLWREWRAKKSIAAPHTVSWSVRLIQLALPIAVLLVWAGV
jgi:hypothetical protein